METKKFEELLLSVQKPGRYSGGEINSVIKDKEKVDVRFAFCFPDTYEIGMSHLGMKILYSQFNSRDDIWCERVFAPWVDMEKNMNEQGVGTFALESLDDISEFDIIGFTLQYELCYTNMLNMLAMSKIPLLSKDRDSLKNLVVVGGPCTCNAEPIADFVDVAFLGEGEEHHNQGHGNENAGVDEEGGVGGHGADDAGHAQNEQNVEDTGAYNVAHGDT